MKVSTIAAILPASPGVITPAASARGDRLHRRGDIRRALDRRQLELDRPLAADRQKAFDAEPQRHRITGERRLDGLARQSFSLAREQLCGGEGSPCCASRAAGRRDYSIGLSGTDAPVPALLNLLKPHRSYLFSCFYRSASALTGEYHAI